MQVAVNHQFYTRDPVVLPEQAGRGGHFAASNVLILAAPNWKGLFIHFTYIVLSHLGAVSAACFSLWGFAL